MAEATAPPPGGSRDLLPRAASAPSAGAVAVARGQVCHPPRAFPGGGDWAGGGRAGGRRGCDAPPTGLCARVTAGPLGVGLPLSVTVGGRGIGEEGQAPPLGRASGARGGAPGRRGGAPVGAGPGEWGGGGWEGIPEWEGTGRSRGGLAGVQGSLGEGRLEEWK